MKRRSFRDSFRELRIERKSILCVGIDPALPRQRRWSTIPKKYLVANEENEERLAFCLDIIGAVKDYAIAIKPNQQYIFGFTKQDHQKLTEEVRRNNMLSILDYKLNDIRDTIESAIFHISESGYDAVTFNPFPGNLSEAVGFAHTSTKKTRGYELGLIVLTLMSNPEAVTYMKEARIGRMPVFKYVSHQVKEYNADGCVVGATGHIAERDIRIIRRAIGPNRLFLIPGIGTQGGDFRKVLKAAGKSVLVNVGRGIIYSQNPKAKAKSYMMKLNSH